MVKETKADMTLRGSKDLADFILKNYSGKVVEVGVGHMPDVALPLIQTQPSSSRVTSLSAHSSKPLEVVITDLDARDLRGMKILEDDIFNPMMEIYQEASLLYSIRPPLEIQIAMGDVAMKVGADVIIRPLGTEVAELKGFGRRLVNHGDATFYFFR
jgi:uncharacterized protein